MGLKLISILGCGWLGLPLGQHLIRDGFRVLGSTTDPAQISSLQAAGIDPYCLTCMPDIQCTYPSDDAVRDASAAFFASPILVLTIPFKRTLTDPSLYFRQVEAITQRAVSCGVRWVIFTGSTSIYPETDGLVDEDVPLVPVGVRATVLHAVEQYLLTHAELDATVLRLAGLYGSNRALRRESVDGTHFSDKVLNRRLNLVHGEDVCGVISAVLKQNLRGVILNVCGDGHPTRKEVIGQGCSERSAVWGKEVSNRKLKKMLNYIFIHPDPGKDYTS